MHAELRIRELLTRCSLCSPTCCLDTLYSSLLVSEPILTESSELYARFRADSYGELQTDPYASNTHPHKHKAEAGERVRVSIFSNLLVCFVFCILRVVSNKA